MDGCVWTETGDWIVYLMVTFVEAEVEQDRQAHEKNKLKELADGYDRAQ